MSYSQQIPLEGVVTVQNSRVNTGKTEYVSEMSITHPQAKPTASDSQGKFTLKVAKIKNGTQIGILAVPTGKYKNFVVVNERELSSITLGRIEPVSVFICKKEDLDRRRAEIIDINIDKYEERTNKELIRLKSEKRKLLKENKDVNQRLQAITDSIKYYNDNLEKSIERIRDYADEFITKNLDQQSENVVKAYACFARGELDSVSYYLPERQILLKYTEANLLQMHSEQKIKEASEEMQLRINTALLQNNFKEVHRLYALAIENDKKNHLLMSQYAFFLTQENQFKDAEKYLLGSMKVIEAKQILNDSDYYLKYDYANVWNFYGNLFRYQEMYKKAEKCYNQSLAIFHKVKEDSFLINNNSFKADYAWLLSNMGNNYRFLKNYDKANQAHTESLQIRKYLYEANSNEYEDDYAKILHNIASSYRDQNKMDYVMPYYQKSLSIWIKLDNKKEQAHVNSSIAKYYNVINQYDEAVKYYDQAIKLRLELATSNPLAHEPLLAKTLYWKGLNQYKNKHYQEAESLFQDSKNRIEVYLLKEYKAYISLVLDNLRMLRNIAIRQNNKDKLHNYIHQTLDICKNPIEIKELGKKSKRILVESQVICFALLEKYDLAHEVLNTYEKEIETELRNYILSFIHTTQDKCDDIDRGIKSKTISTELQEELNLIQSYLSL